MRALSRVASSCALLILVSLVPMSASAWCRLTTSRRAPSAAEPCIFPDASAEPPEFYLAWRRSCSGVALSVTSPSRDLSEGEVLDILARSLATWNAVQCAGQPLGVNIALMRERTTCDAPLYRESGGNVNSVAFVFDWADRMYDPAAFALTTVWHRTSTGEILDADMDLNERRGPYGICPPAGCTERLVDLENVVTHEMGHYLGLAHSEEVEATMYSSAVAGETLKRDLHNDDMAGLCEIYPPGQPGGECDYAPRGGLSLDCESSGCCSVAPGMPSPLRWPLFLFVLIPLRALVSRRRS